MRYSLTNNHREFFQKNGWIQFDDMLTLLQCQNIYQMNNNALASRLRVKKEKLIQESGSAQYLAGRDLWRDEEALKSMALSWNLAHIASQLLQKDPLRLALTHFLKQAPHWTSLPPSLKNLIEKETPLAESSCLEEICVGLLICLQAPNQSLPSPYPSQIGSGIFFSPSLPLPLTPLTEKDEGSWQLWVWTGKFAQYLYKVSDPFLHNLKQLGYVFGDSLKDNLHPLVLQKGA